MTNPHLPDPPAAMETSAEFVTKGRQADAALTAALSRIDALAAGDPWGGDEHGMQLRSTLGDTEDIKHAVRSVGPGVTSFGSVAAASIQTIRDLDRKAAQQLGDIQGPSRA